MVKPSRSALVVLQCTVGNRGNCVLPVGTAQCPNLSLQTIFQSSNGSGVSVDGISRARSNKSSCFVSAASRQCPVSVLVSQSTDALAAADIRRQRREEENRTTGKDNNINNNNIDGISSSSSSQHTQSWLYVHHMTVRLPPCHSVTLFPLSLFHSLAPVDCQYSTTTVSQSITISYCIHCSSPTYKCWLPRHRRRCRCSGNDTQLYSHSSSERESQCLHTYSD